MVKEKSTSKQMVHVCGFSFSCIFVSHFTGNASSIWNVLVILYLGLLGGNWLHLSFILGPYGFFNWLIIITLASNFRILQESKRGLLETHMLLRHFATKRNFTCFLPAYIDCTRFWFTNRFPCFVTCFP